MSVLFVNACVRGKASRTLELCRDFLSTRSDIVEVDLCVLNLKSFDNDMVTYRTAKQQAKAWDDPIFDLAHQFAAADEIVVGAPYWDLSFPAILKTYMEHVCVCDVAFYYTPEGVCRGKCKARKLTYIATCGGFLTAPHLGYEYFRGIADMFDIPETRYFAAEGLDVVGVDAEQQMNKARASMNGE